jgi:hypothetical protein
MNGEGTGGGGALAAILLLWVAGAAFILVNGPLGESADADGVATPPAIVQESGDAEEEATETATPEPELPPAPSVVPDCEALGNCDTPITRAELAAVFAEAFDLPPTTVDFFADDDGTDHEEAINRLAAAGLTGGCGPDQYCPEASVSRGPMAALLARALELPEAAEPLFDDIAESPHQASINAIAAAGITAGCGERLYCPDDPVTGRQLMSFLQAAMPVPDPSS